MNVEEQLYELQKKMEWLIDGYYINCVLPSVKGQYCIPTEWIVKHYNVEWSYFRKH